MAERPQADHRDFQQIGRKRWYFVTRHPYRYVIAPGFFDGVMHSGIAPEDEISVIAMGDMPAVHALMVIDAIDNDYGNRVKVSALIEYRREKLRAVA